MHSLWRSLSRPTIAVAGLAAATAQTSKSWTMPSMNVARADDDALHAPRIHWSHSSPLASFDAASIRRGYHVYANVCASCHSLSRIAYRNLVDVAFTEEEVKAMVEEIEVEDGPNEEGAMFSRPGRLSDYIPSPYPNDEAARYANNGALPPDLSLIVKARHGGGDYLWALLTGYRDAPQGINVRDGLYYNPYFPGGQIAMARALYDDAVEYEDGTPATTSQMAKDVTTFLAWAAEPEHDLRKKMGMQWVGGMIILFFGMFYMKRLKWSLYKTRRLEFR